MKKLMNKFGTLWSERKFADDFLIMLLYPVAAYIFVLFGLQHLVGEVTVVDRWMNLGEHGEISTVASTLYLLVAINSLITARGAYSRVRTAWSSVVGG